MDTAQKRISAFGVEIPWSMPGFPGSTGLQGERQQLGFKYVGIPFGTPAAATGRTKHILRQGAQIGLRRGF